MSISLETHVEEGPDRIPSKSPFDPRRTSLPGEEFNSQLSHVSSEQSVTPVPRDPSLLLTPSYTGHACGTQIHMQAKHIYTNKSKTFKKLTFINSACPAFIFDYYW